MECALIDHIFPNFSHVTYIRSIIEHIETDKNNYGYTIIVGCIALRNLL